MTAPVAPFTIIPLSDVDPDSPIVSSLMDSLRLNDQNLFAQLVGDPVASPTFTPAAEHDHDGVNSKLIALPDLKPKEATDNTTRSTASTSFVDLTGTTITFPAAELTANRKAFIIANLSVQLSEDFNLAVIINVDGVDTNQNIVDATIAVAADADDFTLPLTIVDLPTLALGSDRIIKLRFAAFRSGDTARVFSSVIQAILVG